MCKNILFYCNKCISKYHLDCHYVLSLLLLCTLIAIALFFYYQNGWWLKCHGKHYEFMFESLFGSGIAIFFSYVIESVVKKWH